MNTVVTFFGRRVLTNTDKRRQLAAAIKAKTNAPLKAARRDDPFVISHIETLRQRRLRRRLIHRVAGARSAMETTSNILALTTTSEGKGTTEEALGTNAQDTVDHAGTHGKIVCPASKDANSKTAKPHVKAVWEDQSTLH